MNDEGEHLGDLINELLKKYDKKGRLDSIRITELWYGMMGNVIAKHTDKILLSKDKLIIRVDSAALRQELSYSKQKIMEMINDALGENKVKEVIIR